MTSISKEINRKTPFALLPVNIVHNENIIPMGQIITCAHKSFLCICSSVYPLLLTKYSVKNQK